MTKRKKIIVLTASLTTLAIVCAIVTGIALGTNMIQKAIIRFMCKDEAATVPEDYEEIVASTALTTFRYDGVNELDVIEPTSGIDDAKPILLIFHGGYYVGGGRHNQEPFARWIASKGFRVINVDYSLAPEAVYPAQITQAACALAFVAEAYPQSGFVLSGDSAGAHLAAQLSAAITDPSLRKAIGIETIASDRLRGFIGNCGFYQASTVEDTGFFLIGKALDMLLGNGTYRDNARLSELDVIDHVANFPPSLLVCGDQDPFLPQNEAMAKALNQAGVSITTFFPKSTESALGHEFQCNFDLPESYAALQEIVTFLNGLQD